VRRPSRSVAFPLIVASLLVAVRVASAQTADAIQYTLRFPAPQTHYVDVEARYPTGGQPSLELFMAVWTPGSYLVREYERHVEKVAATANGRALAVEKSRKNRWRITTGGAPAVTVTYRVYGHEMTVRNNWIDDRFAMLNGAPTFLSIVGRTTLPHEVQIELPAAWKSVATPLVAVTGRPNAFRAPDYDTLVDSPIVAGNPVTREFDVDGKKHVLVLEGDSSQFDVDRAAADVRRIVVAAKNVMGPLLYPHYYFLNMVVDASGGLEHKNAFLAMTSRTAMRSRGSYLGWLSLVSHEYFHNWNVKRLRPVELGPFDYENENYVRTLWVAEGFTDYYADLLLRRAGLLTPDEYLSVVSSQIETVQRTPGRLLTPVSQASYDAWIKEYRPDENTANTTISYYPKGAVVAFLLDAKIRRLTNGARSLDDGMRLALQRYSGARGYTPAQFYQTMSEVAGADLTAFFRQAVESTEELDYKEALDWFGLRFRAATPGDVAADLGVVTRVVDGRILVADVRGVPSPTTLNVDDEILAIDDVRVRGTGLASRLASLAPGAPVRVLVSRRDRLATIPVTLGSTPLPPWELEPLPNATPEQKARRARWEGQ
jgi:predicted metalloprotease with PDZ domain